MTEQKQQETATTTAHWPNGHIRESKQEVNGKRRGRQQGWHENGQSEFDWNYDEHGKHHGRQQRWDEGGQPEYDRTYDHGKLHGSDRAWDSKGNLLRDDWHDHGTKCTRWYFMEASKREVEAPAASNSTD